VFWYFFVISQSENKNVNIQIMELQGKVIAALPAREGQSARGPWKAQDFVIETHEAYPRKLVFSVFGEDRLQRFNIQLGQEVNVSFDIDAHEYNGRWYNSVRAFDVRLTDINALAGISPSPAPQAAPFAAPSAQPAAAPASSPVPAGDDDSDLPF